MKLAEMTIILAWVSCVVVTLIGRYNGIFCGWAALLGLFVGIEIAPGYIGRDG
jgi:hypothetical protein